MHTPGGVVALVDDDIFVLRALEHAVRSYGFRVKTYSSAEHYLAEADGGEILCAVIDIELGSGLSGLDLGQRISRHPRATPIVFMTGSDDRALQERALKIGCLAFLHKPFLTSALMGPIIKLECEDSACLCSG